METVRFVGLEKRIHDPVRVYSHGMRQRLALAQALLPRPDLVLLDEPAEGLDPEGIRELRELILRLNRERGLTIVLSSHLLAEVEQTCSRIAILNRGRLVFQGHWDELARDRARYRLEVDDSDPCGGRGRRPAVRTLDPDARTVALPASAATWPIWWRHWSARGARARRRTDPAESGRRLPAHDHRRRDQPRLR